MKLIVASVAALLATAAAPSQAQREHWTVEVTAHYSQRHGKPCRQRVYEDGSGIVCTKKFRIRLTNHD